MASTTLPFPNPTTAQQYATDLDAEIQLSLGKPIHTDPNAVAVTTAWVQAESPTFPGYNGLGTKLQLPGSTNDPSNSQGVQDYPTLQSGLAAAVDMFEGLGPQTTADAPAFVKDVASGKATKQQLVTDIYNSDWSGFSIPDTYDATTIADKLGLKAPSGPKGASVKVPAAASSTSSSLSFMGFPVGALSTSGGAVAKSAVSGLAGTVGNYILKGTLSLIGAGLIFYGATLLTGRGPGRSQAPAAGSGGPAAGASVDDLVPFGPQDAVLAA